MNFGEEVEAYSSKTLEAFINLSKYLIFKIQNSSITTSTQKKKKIPCTLSIVTYSHNSKPGDFSPFLLL